ncbi:MAG: universal stress protein [Paracoccaceae bacterium]|nr:universal stress protein [Paracoccaceae bacterium]
MVAEALDDEHDHEASVEAALLLAAGGARVSILHVREAIPLKVMRQIPADYLEGLRADIRSELDEIAGRFANGTGVLVDGNSGRTIVEWAEANGVDCIVIASHRPGLQDHLLGSAAGRVTGHASCSAHVTR